MWNTVSSIINGGLQYSIPLFGGSVSYIVLTYEQVTAPMEQIRQREKKRFFFVTKVLPDKVDTLEGEIICIKSYTTYTNSCVVKTFNFQWFLN